MAGTTHPPRYHPSLFFPPTLTASMALTFVYLIPFTILSMLLLSSLRLLSSGDNLLKNSSPMQ